MMTIAKTMVETAFRFLFITNSSVFVYIKSAIIRRRVAKSSVAHLPLEKIGGRNDFVCTTLISRLGEERMKKCGINARPYDLRAMFDIKMLIAESQELILRDFRVFFMGRRRDRGTRSRFLQFVWFQLLIDSPHSRRVGRC
jgi:hypothetical protein